MACWLDSGLLVLLIIISVLITVVAMLVFYDFEFCEKYSTYDEKFRLHGKQLILLDKLFRVKVMAILNKKNCGRHTGPVLHHRQVVFTRC